MCQKASETTHQTWMGHSNGGSCSDTQQRTKSFNEQKKWKQTRCIPVLANYDNGSLSIRPARSQ